MLLWTNTSANNIHDYGIMNTHGGSHLHEQVLRNVQPTHGLNNDVATELQVN